jgi:hypothetical protein
MTFDMLHPLRAAGGERSYHMQLLRATCQPSRRACWHESSRLGKKAV